MIKWFLISALSAMSLGHFTVGEAAAQQMGCPRFEAVIQGKSPIDPKTGLTASRGCGQPFQTRPQYSIEINETIVKALNGSLEDTLKLFGVKNKAPGDFDKWTAHAQCLGDKADQVYGLTDHRPFMVSTAFICGKTRIEFVRSCLANGEILSTPCYSQMLRLSDGQQKKDYFIFNPVNFDETIFLFASKISCAPVGEDDLIEIAYHHYSSCHNCYRADYYQGINYLGSEGQGFSQVAASWPIPKSQKPDAFKYAQIMPHYRPIPKKVRETFISKVRQAHYSVCGIDLSNTPTIASEHGYKTTNQP